MLKRENRSLAVAVAVAVVAAMASAPAFAAGFVIFEQGTKAMGMAAAFTAQADDGSAMFYNVAGLAFQKEKSWEAGMTFVRPTADFEGLDPFPGVGVSGDQKDSIFLVPHVYHVRPINDRWTFGMGLLSPFGLATEWDKPDAWAGRFISTLGDLKAIDLNPSLGWQVNDRLGLGIGVVLRYSTVTLERYVGQRNPFNNTVADVAFVKLESDYDHGFGWNTGVLYKGPRFSWGLSYRSKVKIDYQGDGKFEQISTGNPFFDAVVASVIPFGTSLPIQTSIEYPDMASLGVAYALSDNAVVELDANWTGWSSFQEVVLDFVTAPDFSSTIPERYEDANNYRLGVRIGPDGRQWRFGAWFDESPQPDASVGPLLPDADRFGLSFGYGAKRFDLALMYVDFDERTTTTNQDGFLGTYNTTVLLLGATVRFGG